MCKRTKCGLSVYIPCGKIGFYTYVQESTEETSKPLNDFRDKHFKSVLFNVYTYIAHNIILLYKCIASYR